MSRHHAHHHRLLRKLDWGPATLSSRRPLDAIIIPASRKAHRLGPLIDLASLCDTPLVLLASHDCDINEAATLVASRPGSARVVLVDVPTEIDQPALRLATSDKRVRAFSGDRDSNLSLKRNIGLLLARHRGWQKIMFLDDDITDITPDDVNRVAYYLDTNLFAGFKTLQFPDNSVVCHANRLAGRPQGIFVSGGALGVNTAGDRALDVFPDVYNEDWFAFAGEVQRHGVAHVGNIGQLEFNPFKDPARATFEEFGDLLAEGLYALFTDVGGLHRATENYWARFIEDRAKLIEGIQLDLAGHETHEKVQATESLKEAWKQLHTIQPADCVEFLGVWEQDRQQFGQASRQATRRTLDYHAAFEELGLKSWQEARFGVARMPELAEVNSAGAPR
ncbi:hypothetical protein HH310_06365 [Actinoplanes sp. TBRC 11911]|uniref:hypothetical protein n=1 Tax=Actinoplanes sp. TBRC 11911 TaxID=2729386 RepID=UPI00145DD5CF|nr:hypothetical protein [Actinoplanes sp. TBRC 11911]NMO50815.1 hypothetical protein [Actinoplanes sp. TBRC 11911]